MSRSGTPSRALEEKRAGSAARGHDVQRPLRQLCKKAAQPERSPLASNHTRGVEFWLVAVKTENLHIALTASAGHRKTPPAVSNQKNLHHDVSENIAHIKHYLIIYAKEKNITDFCMEKEQLQLRVTFSSKG